MVGREASSDGLIWPYVIPNEVIKQFEDAIMLKGSIALRLPAFPDLMAIVVGAQRMLTLRYCTIMRFHISHFDDGKDPPHG